MIPATSEDHYPIARNTSMIPKVEAYAKVDTGMFAALGHLISVQAAVKMSSLKAQLLGAQVPALCQRLQYQDLVRYYTSRKI